MPGGSPSYEQLAAANAALRAANAELTRVVATLTDRVAELERRLGADSRNSSRPPSQDAPWEKKPAAKRSSRTRSGRKPGKQPRADSSSRSLADDPDRVVEIVPDACAGCEAPLTGAAETGRDRRQVVDVPEVPAPEIAEYQRVSKRCSCCGQVTTPGWDTGDDNDQVVSPPGSPVRIGPLTLARCALLTCGNYLPVGRSRQLLEALCGISVSAGFLAGVRGRAARRLEKQFRGHIQALLASAPVLHADETCGRAAGALSYVHVACTEYLTLMHVGGRSADDIDAGGVLPAFSGVLVRDGYAGYTHLTGALHAWCGAHLLRDLRSIADADPDGQTWADALAGTLTDAHHAAIAARDRGDQALTESTLSTIRSRYHGALAQGDDENRGHNSKLAAGARTLIKRFRRYEDMILRFATDLTVPFTNRDERHDISGTRAAQGGRRD